ncbi:hypothetical protein QTO34_014608 [Cnephaeus nilssonii]|uniref:L1 transposable element RRM domain-containing protein n=1 Tax=Cnephaeus nilssonii TaxID=3371016 RepID=A0AA40I6W5_CNENI|nr:hypothetical protein QTO34_014608 [Eptesicus nilssonii]
MGENKRLDIEFKTMVIRFFKNFLEKASKFNETLEDMKKDHLEIKHILTEIKNIIQKPNSRLEERKNQVKDLEYKEAKGTPPEKQEEKRIQKVEDSVRSLWDNFKRTNIRIMGVPEEEREQDTENLFEEIMTENFPHLVKEIDLQVQEAHRTLNKSSLLSDLGPLKEAVEVLQHHVSVGCLLGVLAVGCGCGLPDLEDYSARHAQRVSLRARSCQEQIKEHSSENGKPSWDRFLLQHQEKSPREKLTLLHYDPFVRAKVLYVEQKKIRSI